MEVPAPKPEPEKTEPQAPEPIESGHENVTKTEIISTQEQVPISQPQVESETVETPQNVVVADVRFENNDGSFKSNFDF